MGLRCELFGHDFGDPTIEESYDGSEQGTVLTVREYKSCKRCEHIRNISENQGLISNVGESKTTDKKSNKLKDGAENRGEIRPREDKESKIESTDSVQAADETEPIGTSVSTVTALDAAAESLSNGEPGAESSVMNESTSLETTDDAVILSEPESQKKDGGSYTPPISDGAAIIDDDQDIAESSPEDPEKTSCCSSRDRNSNSGDCPRNITSDSSEVYQCPRCEFELPMSESSFFPGDVCPQCRVGYLEDISNSGP